MAIITPRALQAVILGKRDDEMIWVKVKDPTGHRYFGRVADLLATHPTDSAKSMVTIQADDGELVLGVKVSQLEWFDVRKRPDGH
ncbi:hypothetical protein AB0E62_00475 [Streptomyces sp. NPDC038707]|uniref:hypothetical protein n=1 Tax=Streptomyces sp. NPDC038707 TaxID=3154329 RepID=UPI0033E952CD